MNNNLAAAAEALAEYLNTHGHGDDWYCRALNATGAAAYYNKAETEEMDPGCTSTLFVLSDATTSLLVEFDPQTGEWF